MTLLQQADGLPGRQQRVQLSAGLVMKSLGYGYQLVAEQAASRLSFNCARPAVA